MEIINIKDNEKYLEEYIELCSLEWGTKKSKEQMIEYIKNKKDKIINEDKVISILGLINDKVLIGFISLFKYDGDYRKDLSPWYATMYVRNNYRGNGYSKILNDAIINEAKRLGYNKLYLKTNLSNYYEKFGFIYLEELDNGENLYYINLNKDYIL